MCTLICRWSAGTVPPVQVLALRDEFAGRQFDDPDTWWPEQPNVVGGRDRAAGGTWCATDVQTGVTAAVLNRPPGPRPAVGAPSRGVLPLLALRHRHRWSDYVDIGQMAGFNLVLATPRSLTWWRHDPRADGLVEEDLGEATHLFRPAGRVEDEVDPRLLRPDLHPHESGDISRRWGSWFAVLEHSPPSDAREAMIKAARGEHRYQTVFGQFIASAPGRLELDYLRNPRPGNRWTHRKFTG